MKSMIKAISAVALTTVMVLPVLADDATTDTDAKDQKDLKKVIEDQGINYVETAQKGITLSGYVDTSYTEQFGGHGTGFGSAQSNLHQFDTQNDNFNLNAVKIALEKALPDKNDWAAGFRIDTILGADARYLGDAGFQSGVTGGGVGAGNTGATNGSGFALEQALVKFRIPVGNGLDIYAGKFVTFLGYEVIESPANPNFSRGLLFTNAIPLTHTGVYADYKFNDTFEAKFGVVDGWNNSLSFNTPNTSDEAFGGKALTGQININAPGKNANLTFSAIYSPNGEPAITNPVNGFGGNPAPTTAGLYVLDLWGNWTPTFDKSGNLTLGFNLDYGSDSYSWYGAALYAQYKLTKVIGLAARGEYLHEDSGANKFGAGGFTNSNGTFNPQAENDWSETLTVSFAVWDNLLTRVEYRFDDIDGATSGTGHTNLQNEISAEAVYSF